MGHFLGSRTLQNAGGCSTSAGKGTEAASHGMAHSLYVQATEGTAMRDALFTAAGKSFAKVGMYARGNVRRSLQTLEGEGIAQGGEAMLARERKQHRMGHTRCAFKRPTGRRCEMHCSLQREGLLPKWAGNVRARECTPHTDRVDRIVYPPNMQEPPDA